MHQNRLRERGVENLKNQIFREIKLVFPFLPWLLDPIKAQFPPGRGVGGLPSGAGRGINDAQLEKEWAQRNELFEIGRKYIFEPEFNDEGMISPANLTIIEGLQKLGPGKIEFDKENMFLVEEGFIEIQR